MSYPVRVLHVVPNMQQGGIENYIMNMYRNVDRDRLQFDFLEHYSTDHFFDDEIRSMGGRIFRIPFMEHKLEIPQYLQALRKFFSNHSEYRIIHGHMGTTASLYLKVAEDAGIANRLVHAHEDSFIMNARGITRMLLIKQSWRHATKLFACSKAAGEYYYGKHEFTVLKNAIDSERFKYNIAMRQMSRKKLGIDGSSPMVLHIGRFSRQKNHVFLLDIFSKLLALRPDATLVMVGDGETKAQIQQKAYNLKLSKNVRFINPTAFPEILYNAADVFILPSLYEGLPLTGIEAQCNGLPCLFSDNTTLDVSLSQNVNFLSLKKTDYEWAQEIVQLLEKKPNRYLGADIIKAKGYDAKDNARLMQRMYLDLQQVG